jgi:hypothetical protein
MQPVAEDVGDEPLGRPARELLGELQDEEHVDPRFLDQSALAFDGRQEPRLPARREDLARVPVEGDGNSRNAAFPRGGHRGRQHVAMPEMDAVEEADRCNRALVLERDRFEPRPPIHRRSVSTQEARTTSGRAFAPWSR